MIKGAFKRFFALEAASGIILVITAAAAMLLKNCPLEEWYDALLQLPLGVEGPIHLPHTLLHWVNDGLMTIFFFLVGLEIKREFIDGELSSKDRAILPIIAAVGGMAMPALIYWLIAGGDAALRRGWAIPCATDIAFSLGVLALLGSRVPHSLKIFLTALAIIDDLGAIIIIALFYSTDLSLEYLFMASLCCIVLFAANRMRIKARPVYIFVGVILWYQVFNSGIHATIAGVLAAFFVPHYRNTHSPLEQFEKALHPWVAYLIMPLFAFFNAGISLQGLSPAALFTPVTMGIALGLFFGKQLGVFISSWAAIKLGVAKIPNNARWKELYGVALLTGIGFTMSLFIQNLAFQEEALHVPARLGIILGSALSAITGYFSLRFTTQVQKRVRKS